MYERKEDYIQELIEENALLKIEIEEMQFWADNPVYCPVCGSCGEEHCCPDKRYTYGDERSLQCNSALSGVKNPIETIKDVKLLLNSAILKLHNDKPFVETATQVLIELDGQPDRE